MGKEEANDFYYDQMPLHQIRYPICFTYTIDGITLKETDVINYLGVHIDNKLTWKRLVDVVVNKANKTRGFLAHNFRYCFVLSKTKYYQTLLGQLQSLPQQSGPHIHQHL